MTNYDTLIGWLENTTSKTAQDDLVLAGQILTSLPSLITYTISMTPLTLAKKLDAKLDAIAAFLNNEEKAELIALKGTLSVYKEKLAQLLPDATKKAGEILAAYLRVEKAKLKDFDAIFSPYKVIYQLPDPSDDEVDDLGSDEEDDTPFTFRKGGFYTQTASVSSYFTLAVHSYMKQWPGLMDHLEPLQHFVEKYPSNLLAQILHQDKKKIVELACSGELSFNTELGDFLLGRILYEAPQWNIGEKVRVAKMQGLLGGKRFDQDEFVFELIKLHLFDALARESQQQPVAWIGSSRSVLAKVRQNPGEGAYLNCDDDKWSPQINRAWLIALLMFNYEIQIVEPQFPEMEKAVLSGDFVKYIYSLAAEMRQYDGSTVETSRINDSMYHGGIEPTATMQELLLLLSLDCQTVKNSEGYLCVYRPKTQEELVRTTTLAAEALLVEPQEEYDSIRTKSRLRLNHSFGSFGRIAVNPVPACTFFVHPGASSDQRSALLMDQLKTNDNSKPTQDDSFDQGSPSGDMSSNLVQTTIEDDDAPNSSFTNYAT